MATLATSRILTISCYGFLCSYLSRGRNRRHTTGLCQRKILIPHSTHQRDLLHLRMLSTRNLVWGCQDSLLKTKILLAYHLEDSGLCAGKQRLPAAVHVRCILHSVAHYSFELPFNKFVAVALVKIRLVEGYRIKTSKSLCSFEATSAGFNLL